MKKVFKKLEQSLSILLTVAMLITCVPETAVAAYAAQDDAIEMETETVDEAVEAETSDTEGIIEEGGEGSEAETPDAIVDESAEDGEDASDEVVDADVADSDEEAAEPQKPVEDAEVSNADEAAAKTFDFKAITVTDEIDAAATWNTSGSTASYTYGEKSAFDTDAYFTTTGNVYLKYNTDKKSQGIEIDKSESGGLVFTTQSKADITVVIASTGKTNNSTAALKKVEKDENGADKYATTAVRSTDSADTNGEIAVTGTGDGKTVNYADVPAGKYAVVSPADDNNRGVRVYSITVTEKGADAPGTWSVETIAPATYNGEAQAPEVVVMSDGTAVADTKYEVTYKRGETETTDFTSAGTITVTVKGKDADADKELTADYVIAPFELTKTNTTVTVDDLAEGKLPVKVEAKLKADATADTELTAGTDYTVSYAKADGTEVSESDLASYDGTLTVKVEGKDNFSGIILTEKAIGDPNKQQLSLTLDVSSLTKNADGGDYTAATGNCENLAGSIFSLIPALITPDSPDTGEVSVDGNEKLLSGDSVAEGTLVSKRLKMAGTGSKESRAIKFTAEKDGVLSVFVMSSSSSAERSVVLEDGSGKVKVITDVAQQSANNGGSNPNPIVEVNTYVYAGNTYYMYGPDGGLNFYYMTLEYKAVPKEIDVELSATELGYDGTEKKPEITVKSGDAVVDAANYEVTYERDGAVTTDFINTGVVTVKVAGKAGTDYAGSTATASYEIKLATFTVELSATEFVYGDYQNIPPTVTVKLGDTVVEPANYTYEYSLNGNPAWVENAGTYTVTVTGREGTQYAGVTGTAEFVIKPLALSADNAIVRVLGGPVYEGDTPNVDVLRKYAEHSYASIYTDQYTLAYANATTNAAITDLTKVAAGTKVRVTATAIANGNYTGSVSGEYTVVRKPLGMGDEGYYVDFIVDGERYEGYYDAGSFITIPGEVMDALDGRVVEGWYTDSSFSAKSKWDLRKNIVEKDYMCLYARTCSTESSDGLYVQNIPVQVYTGKDIKPAVVVYASDGKTLLKSGKDYTLTYANNKDANVNPDGEPLKRDEAGNATGLSTVTITGKGNYSSENPIVKTFAIRQVNLGWDYEGVYDDVSVKFTDQLVTKAKTQKVLSSVKANKKALKAGTDFEATLYKGTTPLTDKDTKGLPLIPANAETYTYGLEITGINNYAGTWYADVYVADAANLMKNAKIKLGKNLKTIEYATLVSNEWTGWESKASTTASDDTFTVTGKNGVIDPSEYDVGAEYSSYEYEGGIGVGKAQLVIYGKGTYVGYKTIPFTVKGSAFSEKNGISITGIADRTYTGEALYQNDAVVTVPASDGKTKTLSYMQDYTITYKNNIKKGKATMTFTATPSSGYTGSIKKTFAINAATLKGEMITEGLVDSTNLKMAAMPYSKVALKPANKLTLQMIDQNYEGNTAADGAVLKEGTDYTVKYKDNNKVGTATITLKGKGSITGEVNVSFDIETASLSDLYDDGVVVPAVTPVQAKSGGTKDYAVKLKVLESGKALKAKKDYTLSLDKIPAADVNAYVYPADGAARGAQPTVTVTGTGSYKDSITVPLSFFDKANKIAKNTVTVEVAPAVYNNGKQVTPGVTVKFGTTELDECDETGEGDYTVTYGKNNVAGKNKGSVTITGQGIYGGKLTQKFTILPKPLNGEIDELDTAFYYGYINDKIGKHLSKIQGKVDGIGTVTYEDSTHTFTVPVTDKTVNIDGTFTKLVDTYRNHPYISAGMAEVKDVFTADIRNAKEIVISATYVDSKGNETTETRRRDPAKYIDKYENAAASSIIDDVLSVYEDRIKKYNNILGKDLKSYTLDKVAGKSGKVTVTINYKTGKAPVVLTYNVNFTDATAK